METSWKTNLLGWIVIAGDAVGLVVRVIQEQGLPSNLAEWFAFGCPAGRGNIA